MTKKMLYEDLLTTDYIFSQLGSKIKIIKIYFDMPSVKFNKIFNHTKSYIDISGTKILYRFDKNSNI